MVKHLQKQIFEVKQTINLLQNLFFSKIFEGISEVKRTITCGVKIRIKTLHQSFYS
jgi:hypothetical protein